MVITRSDSVIRNSAEPLFGRGLAARGKVLAGLIWILSLASLGGALVVTVRVIDLRVFSTKPKLHTPALVWLGSSALADIGVVLGMFWSLSRRKTGFEATDGMIDKIIRCMSLPSSFILA